MSDKFYEAIYDYTGEDSDDLNFKVGDTIEVIEKQDISGKFLLLLLFL